MRQDGKIDYIEMAGGDLPAVKAFYAEAFGWTFTDYGPEYAAFEQGVDGGFGVGAKAAPLVVLWAADLEAYLERVTAAGGEIVDPIFSFPGGRRFHFRDPAGNLLGVWSEG